MGHDGKIQVRHTLTLEIRDQRLLPDRLLLAAAAVHKDCFVG